ncbi:MAG: membrane integrity-associated transporter subunit PqiC [Opitutaceae bacterium]|nr:membrane integrity-associated transporter subunit PqiC [Opitutaceae bacterium]
MKTRFAAPWMLLTALLGLAGCSIVPAPQADLTRYYVLTGSPLVTAAPPADHGLRLGLKKIKLAPYLQKGSIVVRRGENELAYHDVARWAEPLADNIAQLVRHRLLADGRVGRVFTEGFPFDQERDYDVAISINRCEGAHQAGATVTRFSAVIEITAPSAEGRLVARRIFSPRETPWDGRDFGALVQALSSAVDALGDDVVAALPVK